MGRGLAPIAEGMLLLLLCAAPWPHGAAGDAARFVLSAALLVAAAFLLAGTSPRAPFLPALGALPAVALLQLLLGRSAAPAATLEALLVLLATLGALVVSCEAARDRGAALRLAAAVLAAAGAQAAFAAVQWSLGPARIYGVARPDVTMPFGSFVNHNHFAGYVAMSALLAFGMAAGHARRSRQVTPWSVGLFALGFGLVAAQVASRSRGGLLALAVGMLVCAILCALFLDPERARAKAPRLLLLVAGALAVVGFGLLAAAPSARRHLATLVSGAADASLSYRLDTGRATLRLFASRPLLGAGFGAFADAVPRFKQGHGTVRTTHAESDALQLLAEGGLLGGGAAAWLGAALLLSFRRRLLLGRDPLRRGLAIGAASGAAALAVHSLFDFNLRIPSNALVFAVLLGLAVAPPGQEAPRRASGLCRASAVGLLVLSLVAGWRAHADSALAAALSASGPDARIERLSGVLALHPYLAEAWQARGVAWRDLSSRSSPLSGARLERAVADLGCAVRIRPAWAAAWSDLGWARAMLGDFAAAARDLDHAAELDPTHPGIRLLREEFSRRSGFGR